MKQTLSLTCLLAMSLAAQERFDLIVRNDFFAGFAGDAQALARGMKYTEETLARDPKNAEALVWHGAGTFSMSGRFFQAGEAAKGQELWQRGLKEMEDAARMAPDRIGVRIPRGASLLAASRFLPDAAMAKPLIETALTDYEHALELQKSQLSTLGTHPLGELLIGLADGYARLGKTEQAQAGFERLRAALPGTPYAVSAQKWLDTRTLAPREAGCLGCHTAK